jgi:hypothetical protein
MCKNKDSIVQTSQLILNMFFFYSNKLAISVLVIISDKMKFTFNTNHYGTYEVF